MRDREGGNGLGRRGLREGRRQEEGGKERQTGKEKLSLMN